MLSRIRIVFILEEGSGGTEYFLFVYDITSEI